MLAGAAEAEAEGSHGLRLLTLARAMWARDASALGLLRRHWAAFDRYVEESSDGYCLSDPATIEQHLAAAMLGISEQRSARAARESRSGSGSEKACAKRARAGALRAAQVWQPRRSTLRLSGVRVVGSMRGGDDEVVRTEKGMAEAIKQHWLPVFQASEDDTDELLQEASAWTKRWGFSGLQVQSESEVAEVIRRGRRTSLVAGSGAVAGSHDVHAHPRVCGWCAGTGGLQ